ncbi:MAG: phenylacetate--CoA ligase family protein, partial [Alphaproteobacteria bacterium]|nr:phenylacetate--CoA ligase family protein [Alphaproteobacteria bacterium]
MSRPRSMWNQAVETMPPLNLEREFVRPRLALALRHAFERSPFWRERFTAAGVESSELTVDFDLSRLPVVSKVDILADQAAHPPYGSLLAVSQEDLCRIHRTSGTTSRPLFITLTLEDVVQTLEAGARAFVCAGVKPTDTIIHCLNYCMWSGGLTDHLCLEQTGATVIPFGVGNSRL